MEIKFKRVQEEINDLKYLKEINSLDRRDEKLLKELEALMDYAHSCEKLKEKGIPTIQDWLKDNFKRLDRHSFTNVNEDTIWLRSELVEIYNAIHL